MCAYVVESLRNIWFTGEEHINSVKIQKTAEKGDRYFFAPFSEFSDFFQISVKSLDFPC